MKTLDDYMAMSYRMEIVEDKDEGGFVVSYPDLPGCITCGETVENAVANAFFNVVNAETIPDMLLLYSDEYCVKLSEPSFIAACTADNV